MGFFFSYLLNIETIYCSICDLLKDLGKNNDDLDHKPEAICILKSFKAFDFVFHLYLMIDILGVTYHLNRTLQRNYQDIINAMNQVSSFKKAI